MTNSLMLGGIYILMAVMLVLGTLMSRREPFARMLTMSLAWLAIFAGGFVVFTFRDDLSYVGQRLRAEATGVPVTQGEEIRIPMAIDGHFWVDGRVNGKKVKFLIDSGATMTTVGRKTAARLGMEVSPQRNQIVRTGNGLIRVATGRAQRLEVGTIERADLPVHIADDEDLNVLGMNFLSSLQRWGVEGRWLILVP
ncbi:MAG TPA: TIGR02281 family clan AA aspartic protease [Sphingomicrobium sp.]|nr:TIGR02281 family clan AA aspartic protease [Sphingomicrobium sp.]